jgi:prepilin-type N-terminal cleavage/methylation domain-containing protein
MLRIRNGISQQGFTVTELMIVVGIMGIMISIAAVSISSSLRQNRLRDATRELEGEIMMIRNVARTQQTRVVSTVTSTNIRAVRIDTANEFLNHTYDKGVQFAVTSNPGAGAVAPLTTFQFNEAGNITDANRVITITMSGESARQYRIWIFTTGSTRVFRSDDGGVTWPTRPW